MLPPKRFCTTKTQSGHEACIAALLNCSRRTDFHDWLQKTTLDGKLPTAADGTVLTVAGYGMDERMRDEKSKGDRARLGTSIITSPNAFIGVCGAKFICIVASLPQWVSVTADTLAAG